MTSGFSSRPAVFGPFIAHRGSAPEGVIDSILEWTPDRIVDSLIPFFSSCGSPSFQISQSSGSLFQMKMLLTLFNGHSSPLSPSSLPCSSLRSLYSSPGLGLSAPPRNGRQSPSPPFSQPRMSQLKKLPLSSHPLHRSLPHLPLMTNVRPAMNVRWGTASSLTTCRLVPMVSTTCMPSSPQMLMPCLNLPFALRYLHLGFKAPPHVIERERVRVVWAILRQRHPLLASTVEMHDYDDVRFV